MLLAAPRRTRFCYQKMEAVSSKTGCATKGPQHRFNHKLTRTFSHSTRHSLYRAILGGWCGWSYWLPFVIVGERSVSARTHLCILVENWAVTTTPMNRMSVLRANAQVATEILKIYFSVCLCLSVGLSVVIRVWTSERTIGSYVFF